MYELSQLRQSLCHQFKIFPNRALQFLTSYVCIAVIIIQILYNYNITKTNVPISVAKGDISLHGTDVGHSPFSY